MKSFLLFLSCIFSLAASAQDDTVHISLTAHQHTVLMAYMQDKGEVQRNRYVLRMRDSIKLVQDTLGVWRLQQPEKQIRYAAPVSFVEDMFLMMGSQQERLVASDNRLIQQSLMGQLVPRRMDVVARIAAIVESNAAQHDQVIQANAIDYLQKLKE